MRRIIQYSKSAIYHILQNKMYALFCISGTALTILFVAFLLQIGYMLGGNYPPAVFANRTIRLGNFTDISGKNVGCISSTEIYPFFVNLREYETFSVSETDVRNVFVNGQFLVALTGFVNAGFWDVYKFHFVAGRPFTEDDWINRKSCAIITKSFSKAHFKKTNSVGEKINLMGFELEIIGVVDNVSLLSSPTQGAQLWIPNNITEPANNANIDILFPEQMDMLRAKEILSKAVIQEFLKKNISILTNKDQLHTLKEAKLSVIGSSIHLALGSVVFLILLIPSVNIVTLNSSFANNMAEMIAIRRAFGASRLSSFLQIMLENLFLAMIGAMIGVILVKPVFSMIQHWLLGTSFTGGASIVTGVDFKVILTAILPVTILFSVMSGGFPAFHIANCNIADILKKGIK